MIEASVDQVAVVAAERAPCIVAVDGLDGAGKTTFALAVVDRLGELGVSSEVLAADDFRPEGYFERSAADAFTPQEYFAGAYDYVALRIAIAEASRRSRCVVVEGIWLLRPELQDHWDLSVFLTVGAETALQRIVARDAPEIDEDVLLRRYRSRCHPAYALYEQLADPRRTADIVIDTGC